MEFVELIFEKVNWHMWMTFFIISIAIVLFVTDRVQIEITCVSTVAALLLFFHFFPYTDNSGKNLLDIGVLLKGFANPVLFAIFSLLIIGQGLFQTGAIDGPSKFLTRLGRGGARTALIATLLTAGMTSAFLNNTPVVVIFVPIISAVSANVGLPPGRALMPLSFICILGGMTTLIGSSANLIAASEAIVSGIPRIGFFDFVIPGLFLASLGGLYVIFVLPRILTQREGGETSISSTSGRQFVAEIDLGHDHPWIGVKSFAGLFPKLKDITVRMIHRHGRQLSRPFDDVELKQGDVVSVAATRNALTDILTRKKKAQTASDETESDTDNPAESKKDTSPNRQEMILVEAAIAPGSSLIGRNIHHAHLQGDIEYSVIGVQRHRRMLRRPLSEIQLLAGDVLLLLGSRQNIRKLRRNNNFFLMEWSASEMPSPHHSTTAIIIFVLTIVLAATGLLPISIAAMIGALAMIVTGCLTIRQASRALDRRIYLLIGTAFAMAEPLRITGGAEAIAGLVVQGSLPFGPAVTLSAFFLLAALLTNFLSNQATAALLAPVAVSTALQIDVDPAPFIYGLIFALNCSFATPLAYQTNLIVMGPGNYRFSDYVKGGLPLVVIIWIAYSIFAPLYFDL